MEQVLETMAKFPALPHVMALPRHVHPRPGYQFLPLMVSVLVQASAQVVYFSQCTEQIAYEVVTKATSSHKRKALACKLLYIPCLQVICLDRVTIHFF